MEKLKTTPSLKKTNYKLQSKIFKGLGIATMGVTIFSGFFVYQAVSNWEEFKLQLDAETFSVVNPETVKLNPFFAFPLLVALIVFIIMTIKKNKEFFNGKMSMGLIITMAIVYFIYSIAIVTMATLAGAFVGSILNEIVFNPLAVNAKKKNEEIHEIDLEYEKEKRRIIARKLAREELDGSV